jgi:hypothetical protein
LRVAATDAQAAGLPPLLLLPPELRLTPEQFALVCDANPEVAAFNPSARDYMANGARLRWLQSPKQRAVEFWRAGVAATAGELQRIEPALALEEEEEELLPGLRLELAEIWAS